MDFILLYVVALITVTGAVTENITSAEEIELPTLRIYGISDFDDEGPTIHWLLYDESKNEPVLGYKVKLWQVGCDKMPKYKIVDGERVRLKNVMPRLRDVCTLRNLTEFTLEGEKNNSLFLKDIESDIPYHMTVAAYTARGEGPPSAPFRFQHRGRYTCREI